MAGFVGYIVGANKIAFPWAIAGGPLAGVGPFADIPGETMYAAMMLTPSTIRLSYSATHAFAPTPG